MIWHIVVLVPLLGLLALIMFRCLVEWGMPFSRQGRLFVPAQTSELAQPPNEKKVFFFALMLRALIFMVAICAVMLKQGDAATWPNYLEQLNLWDAKHYVNLIEQGYSGYIENGQHLFLVFFPAYVWIVRIVRLVIPNTLLAGTVTSWLCYAWGCCWVHKLAYEKYDLQTANNAVVFLSLFPFSFFFGNVMTEGMFLLATSAALYCALNHKWAAYGLWGVLASLTRMTGILVIVPAFIEFIKSCRSANDLQNKQGDVLKKLPFVFLPICGTLAYLWLNYAVDGDPFAFVIHQKHWSQGKMIVSNVIAYIVKNFVQNSKVSIGWALWLPELLIFVAAVVLLMVAARRLQNPASLLMYGFVYLVANYSLSWLLSAGRYMSCGLVFFVFLAECTRNKKMAQLGIIAAEAAFLGVYLSAYLSGAQIM